MPLTPAPSVLAPRRITLPQFDEPLTPTLAFGTGDGLYSPGAGDIRIALLGAEVARFVGGALRGPVSACPLIALTSPSSATVPVFTFVNDENTGVGRRGTDNGVLIAGGVTVADFVEAAGVGQFIVPTQNDAANPSIGFGAGNDGIFQSSEGALRISIGGVSRYHISDTFIQSNTSLSFFLQRAAGSATDPIYAFNGDEDTGIGRVITDQLALIAGGLRCLSVSEVGGVRRLGFYEGSPVALQTGVPVTTSAVHAALVALRLITA